MNRTTPTLLCFLILIVLACNNTPDKPVKQATSPPATTAPTTPLELFLPSMTMDKMKVLWETCNQIDYIFYNLPISSSVNDAPSAQAHLRHISETPVEIKTKDRCEKPIGRIFYKSDGNDLMEADIFFAGGCAFYVFYEDGKRTHSNLLTPDGVSFFNQIIESVSKAKQQQGQ